MTVFLIDQGIRGFEMRRGYDNVAHRGYNSFILLLNDCRAPHGEVHRGFEAANKWLEVTRAVADEVLQIHGGMGLMMELPLQRIRSDARIERICEGTS